MIAPDGAAGIINERFEAILHTVALGFEIVGVAAIVIGAVVAGVRFAARLMRDGTTEEAYHILRITLARAILLGLEFLVAADIIGTVAVQPTLENVSILGLIVLIRTFLSFALQIETEGRWPWQKAHEEPKKPTPS